MSNSRLWIVVRDYELSVCYRKTYIIRDEIIYDINESDDWQERILQNFQEFEEKMRKSKSQPIAYSIDYDEFMDSADSDMIDSD